jgi:hypothetical protein
MTTFFLDLWQDLREKRLWPVAVGLLAAAVAIPAVMLKPAADPTTPPPAVANTGQRATLPAVSVDDSPTHGSKLQTFSQRNPFKPLKDLEKQPGSPTPAGGSGPGAGGQGSGGGSGSPSGGSGGGSGGGSTPVANPVGGDGGGSPTPSGPTPTPGSGPGGMHWFKFTADIDFGRAGDAKRMKDVESLTLLPRDDNPIVVFMGVTADAKGAKFLVNDPNFTADGEGDCNGSEDCQFVTLGLDDAHNEETFTSKDGKVAYDLKLVRLNRDEVSQAEATGDTAPGRHHGKIAASSAGGETISDASREFLPALLAGPNGSVTDLGK